MPSRRNNLRCGGVTESGCNSVAGLGGREAGKVPLACLEPYRVQGKSYLKRRRSKEDAHNETSEFVVSLPTRRGGIEVCHQNGRACGAVECTTHWPCSGSEG